MSFLFSLFSLLNMLQFQIVWKDTIVEIPLHEDIYQYRDIPYAEIYQYGVKLSDPDMYYEYNGVERTFYHTINSKYVGVYQVKYKVHFPTYQQTSIQNIIFKVVDLIPPEFLYVPTFKIHIGSSLPKVLEGVIYQDNYDAIESLVLTADTTRVILNRVGIYPMTYQVKDLSGNQTTATSNVEIYDHEPPTIEKMKPITLNVGEVFDYASYYKIKDNVDPFPKVFVDISKVDFHHLGTYDISITATDQSGLSKIFSDVLMIVDTLKPSIMLTRQILEIDYGSEISEQYLRSLILSVSDNYSDVKIDDVSIYHEIEMYVLGSYKVYYELRDHSYNTETVSLTLTIKDLSPPIIEIIKEMRLPVFSEPPLLYDYIDVQDLYNDASHIDIKITSAIKTHTLGHYLVTIKATDTSRNESIQYVYFEVYDDISPDISLKQEIVITEFQKIPFHHYVDVVDQYDASLDIELSFDDTDIDYEKVGYYPLIIQAKDTSGNVSTLEVIVMVLDIEPPILNLKHALIYLSIEDQPLDLMSYIIEAYDQYDHLGIEDVIITSDIMYHQPGWYEVLYELKDQALNQTTQSLMIVIEDTIKPSLTFEDMTILPDPYFNPLDYVVVSDNYQIDGDILCACQNIDFSIPGEKIIHLYAKDSRGNLAEAIMIVEVLPYPETIDYLLYLPVLIVLMLGGGAIFMIRRYRW